MRRPFSIVALGAFLAAALTKPRLSSPTVVAVVAAVAVTAVAAVVTVVAVAGDTGVAAVDTGAAGGVPGRRRHEGRACLFCPADARLCRPKERRSVHEGPGRQCAADAKPQ